MKKVSLLLVFLLAMAGTAMAAGTNTLTVSASVTSKCDFTSTTSTLAFGSLDPATNADATASTTIQAWCTKGVTSTSLSNDLGQHASGTTLRMSDGGTNYLPYTLGLSPASVTGTGINTPTTITLNGTVAKADIQGAAAGSYSDTVTLTINP